MVQIVTLASSLAERLNNESFWYNTQIIGEQQTIDSRVAHWCKLVAQGDWENFHKRLSWDGLDVERVSQVLGSVCLDEDLPLPGWAETLSEIIKTSEKFNHCAKTYHSNQLPIEEGKPLPFEDILLPAILVARQKLLTSLGCASVSLEHLPLDLVSIDAYLALERGLLRQVSNLCEKTLESEFSGFRPLGYNLFNLMVKESTETENRVNYDAFVEKLLQDGLLTFFQQYPVLGRLVATAIDFWVEGAGEFLQRLKADRAEIEQLFLLKSSNHESEEKAVDSSSPKFQLGKVIAIHPNLSDPHNRGDSVMAIEFESGLKLVYKPKNLGLEVSYNQFLEWCNQHGAPLPLKVVQVCDRQTYGWVEYVEHLPLEDELAAKRFYKRTGMLLCILYLLQGNDCHRDNLIACGEHLVLIDMETLMHHSVKELSDLSEGVKAPTAIQKLSDSVLRTGMLPDWRTTGEQEIVYDLSGLGSVNPDKSPTFAKRRKFVNTDDMHLGLEKIPLPAYKNEAILHGVSLSANNYVDEIAIGFEQMYRFLIEQRQSLLSINGIFTKLQAKRVRFVFRATQVYAVILQGSLAPQFLKNGIDRSIELDILSRAFLFASEKPPEWSILQAELKAMEQLDIPYFGAKSDSDDLTVGLKEPIKEYFEESSYSQVRQRLQRLNEKDLARQVSFIKSSFYAKMARKPAVDTAKIAAVNSIDFSDIKPLTSKQLLNSAQIIARSIEEQAIREPDDSFNWISLGFSHDIKRFRLQILPDNLYSGKCGLALFLAALDLVEGKSQFLDLSLGAIQPLRELLQTLDRNNDNAQKFSEIIGIGGITGLSSLVYCLVKIGQFLKESTLLEDACRAANLIAPEAITADRQFDIIGGAAGAILGLLALYDETEESAILAKAILWGQHLLAHRVSINNSPRAWKNVEEKPLTGFSHGAAGIAYALLRLYAATGDSAYQEAAVEGIAYERSVFNPSAGNWPDLRSIAQQPDGSPGFMASWCHGAPGIGLARLGSLEILDTKEVRQDLEVALRTTQMYGLHGVDHLCCGNFGRIEVLLLAAKTLGREELYETAIQQASALVTRAEQAGGYQLFGNLPNSVFIPSFFIGTAGIGYELLRLAYPEKLPSVLLMA